MNVLASRLVHDFVTRSPGLRRLLAALSFVLGWSLLLAAYDLALCRSRAPGADFSGLAFYATAVGAFALLLGPLAIVRTLLRSRARGGLSRAAVGALDGAAVAYCLCYRADYATIGPSVRWLFALVLIGASAAAFALVARANVPSRIAGAALCGAALVLESRLPFRELDFAHLGLDLLAFIGFAYAASDLWALPLMPASVAAAVGVAFAAWVSPSMRGSELTRALVYELSTHTRVHVEAMPARLVASKSRSLRPKACGRGKDPCTTRPAVQASRYDGTLRGADVLMLSIDALRWDYADALAPLMEALGERVHFERAFSPAPRTAHSFAAMLRGRPLRQVLPYFNGRGDVMVGDAPDTLGAALRAHGYRSVYVPAHRFLAPSSGIATGFESLLSASQQTVLVKRAGRTPISDAAALIVRAAQETKGPLFAWTHAMETHHPYRWNGGEGPSTSEGQKHAAHDAAVTMSELVRDFREARKGRPVVVVVFADHGEEFGEHGGEQHSSTVHAELVRVVMTIAGPTLPNRAILAPVSTTAIASTLLSLLGVEPPCSFTVPSLLACIESDGSCPKLAVSELARSVGTRIVRTAYSTSEHRLLRDVRHETTRLFDMSRDPLEANNLAPQQPFTAVAIRRAARPWDDAFCVPARNSAAKFSAAR